METLLTSPKRGGKMPESRWSMAWTKFIGQGFKVCALILLVDLVTQKGQSEPALVHDIDPSSTTLLRFCFVTVLGLRSVSLSTMGHADNNDFVFHDSIFLSSSSNAQSISELYLTIACFNSTLINLSSS